MVCLDHYSAGDLYGIKYTFTEPGEGLPSHSHDSDQSHNCICLVGRCVIFGEAGVTVLNAGEFCDIDGSKEHAIAALTFPTQILNFYYNGAPEGYHTRPESERHLQADLRVEIPAVISGALGISERKYG